MASWVFYKEVKEGERVWRSYRTDATLGTIYKETISYIDQATGLVKAVADAFGFVGAADAALSWSKESASVQGERHEELYSATISGGKMYLSIVSYLDNASGFVRSASASMGEVSTSLALGDHIVQGAVIGYKDNATSMRCKGPRAPSEGGTDVQSYSGIFYNDAYAGTGTLKTRVIHGANIEMDLEIQSPHQLRLAAVDDSQVDGKIWAASKTNFVFNMRADAETASPKQFIIDRINTGSTGTSNTSDINLKATGSLYLNNGVTLGSVVLPSLTNAQETALTPVAGMIHFNSDTGKAVVYDGALWQNLF